MLARRAAILAALALLALGATSASAAVPHHIISVDKVGTGYVSGPGIDCGTDCNENVAGDCTYDPEMGQVVCDDPGTTVTADDATGSAFNHRAGCDSAPASRDCSVVLFDDRDVTAYY